MELIIHQRKTLTPPTQSKTLVVPYQILFKADRNLERNEHQSWALPFGVLISQRIFKASLILKVLVLLRLNCWHVLLVSSLPVFLSHLRNPL